MNDYAIVVLFGIVARLIFYVTDYYLIDKVKLHNLNNKPVTTLDGINIHEEKLKHNIELMKLKFKPTLISYVSVIILLSVMRSLIILEFHKWLITFIVTSFIIGIGVKLLK